MNREKIEKINAWDKVGLARHKDRPNGKYYIDNIFDDFIELHGDRHYGDDKAIVGGIAYLDNKAVTVIAICKGQNTKENIERNFGMPKPEGYRKALRLMKEAEKFKRPVICFVDTPGAFCGVPAEERGIGEAIASNLLEMSRLKTPIISVFIGEGGSGGALALAVADKVLMLENSIYSILSPEGFASILWKDVSRVKEAAEAMKITAQDLKDLKVIDRIVKEPCGAAHSKPSKMCKILKKSLIEEIQTLINIDSNTLIEKRYNKFRNMGAYGV
ncbi:MAG: acetyl-CoA carboxylase carboxyltransferase subunit alpha [Clostridium sp.]|jgi:acetyl-CoA carboxylase carboxyl transferase subunit alpha|nr:acetyl-CoA carboxylase carboxyltransferase subunit alpha [Clostridium sp.]